MGRRPKGKQASARPRSLTRRHTAGQADALVARHHAPRAPTAPVPPASHQNRPREMVLCVLSPGFPSDSGGGATAEGVFRLSRPVVVGPRPRLCCGSCARTWLLPPAAGAALTDIPNGRGG